ncbi:gephyrin-like molybdotransferase Glp [Arthrobacter sp. M4]|uniref:molybdopterin molybdotransferase MoeA n=1 Tax=Arthrobacter sp. M4 TaxID=218160 RepID=UPI001CDC3284|nr:gephyrin-like molybdotransferase Glp [Arthrobacter sp. M4]MCA4134632.1 molybdopterin molybdotransferase MoeA [Arthrobacter sp. M4]
MARSVADHRQAVLELLADAAAARRSEQLPLSAGLGRVLATDVAAPLSLPPFDNSQMDGYAVRSADFGAQGATLRVADPVPAGAAPRALEPGTAAPIMTGAMLPEGADAVVPIERAVPDSFPLPGAEATVILPEVAPGDFVRPIGSDITVGATALVAGTALGPAQLGLLAALGLTSVVVRSPLRVLLITTGDEVVEPGTSLTPGKIYDANGTLLEAAMVQAGLTVHRSGITVDDPGALLALLRSRAAEADLIVSTGGVSKGAYEVVRQALHAQPVEFLSVAMQPGGPQGIGRFDGVPFLGFPGNPVSCLVSFEMFLRPVLTALVGAPPARTALTARLAEPLSSPAGKHQIRRGTYLPELGTVRLEGGSGSHLVHALANSNCLVHVPVGVTDLPAGQDVEIWML